MNYKICTPRKYQHWPSYDLVYEWEDILKEILGVKFCYEKQLVKNKFLKRIPFLYTLLTGFNRIFSYEMTVYRKGFYCRNSSLYIPCIIDYFASDEEIPLIEKSYSRCKKVIITSKEVYDYLKKKECIVYDQQSSERCQHYKFN